MSKIKFNFLIICFCLLFNGCTDKDVEVIKNNDIPADAPNATKPFNVKNTLNRNKTEMQELNKVLDDIKDINNLLSLSILKGDTWLAERYYHDADSSCKNNIYSVTKSVISILIGIAIDQGYISSVDQTIGEYLNLDELNLTEEHQSLTIRHLLTMSSGLKWKIEEMEFRAIKIDDDPIRLILEREIDFKPGTSFRYSNGNIHLLSMILSEAVGADTSEYASENLFEPLGINDIEWAKDAVHNTIGSSDLHLSCQDMTKIGQLMLDKGNYEGQQIVSEAWIEESTTFKINSDSHLDYGYLWNINNTEDISYYAAIGYGGQYIYIFPDKDLVITASCNGSVYPEEATNQSEQISNAILNRIVPLLRESN